LRESDLVHLAVVATHIVPVFGRLPGLQPAAGEFFFSMQGEVCFRPRHPFLAGTAYSLLRLSESAEPVELGSLAAPENLDGPTTRVLAIQPAVTVVPANLLRLYVHFSAPMSEGQGAHCLRLLDADSGDVIEGALLMEPPELWDRGHRRLTVLVEPGRVKRGLRPNREAGRPLNPGRTVAFEVQHTFRDAHGLPLAAGARQTSRVGAPVYRRVDPGRWEWRSPMAGTRDPLTVRFDRPLDSALLESSLVLLSASGAPVEGRAIPASDSCSWRFEPAATWETGAHCALVIDPRLEDLAGNNLYRVFDRDLERSSDNPGERRRAVITIHIAGAA
jgi:hypothetical protein